MSERISTDEVAHVAHLARLHLDDAELVTFTEQLAAVLDHVTDLEGLDLSDLEPTSHPYPLRNVFRADVAGESLDRAEVLASAPSVENHQFRVPPILGDD